MDSDKKIEIPPGWDSPSPPPPLPSLPPKARALVDEYESLRELGASKTVRMINDVLALLAVEGTFQTSIELIAATQQAAEYFRQTRGKITPAVGNALNQVLNGLESFGGRDLLTTRSFVAERVSAFNRESLANTARIAGYAASLLSDGMQVLAYDYSGTVMATLKQASEVGKRLQVIVPESRTLNGGRPIADKAIEWGHSVAFIADAVIGYFMPQADIVLEGVETLFANGDFLGTPGTFTVGLLARHFGVPFYALTETLKIAPQTLFGPVAPVATRWLADIFDHPRSFSKPEAVSVESPGLERVSAEYVTAYVTERGLLPPQAIWYEARRLLGE